jgi:hypothetical protein
MICEKNLLKKAESKIKNALEVYFHQFREEEKEINYTIIKELSSI